MRWLNRTYAPLLRRCLARPGLTAGAGVLALAASLATVPFIGGEFMPKLEEGNLWVRATMPNSISFEAADELVGEIRATLKRHPEVTSVVSQLGQNDEGTEAVGWFNADLFVNLTPPREWARVRLRMQQSRRRHARRQPQCRAGCSRHRHGSKPVR